MTNSDNIIAARERAKTLEKVINWLREIPEAFRPNSLEYVVDKQVENGYLQQNDALRIMEWMDNPTPFLILYGPPGTGKTYIGAKICETMLARRKTPSASYVSASRLMEGFSDYQDRAGGGMLARAKHPQLLFIDDIGAGGLTMTDTRRSAMWELIDYRWSTGRNTIITTNLSVRNDEAPAGNNPNLYDTRPSIREFLGESVWDRLYGKTYDGKSSNTVPLGINNDGTVMDSFRRKITKTPRIGTDTDKNEREKRRAQRQARKAQRSPEE